MASERSAVVRLVTEQVSSADELAVMGVVGAGQMGNGIAHVAAAAGYVVHLQDVSAAALDKARATIEANLARQIKKGALTEAEGFAVMGRIHTSTEVAPLGAAQLVIEAATESRAIKLKIFEALSRVMAPPALLASNTSSSSILARSASAIAFAAAVRSVSPASKRCSCAMYPRRTPRCTLTSPESNLAVPQRILRRVVLPPPLRPTSPTRSPG